MKTLLDLIRQPLVIGAFVLSILIVVGAYFGSNWYYGEVKPVPDELSRYTPTPAVRRGVSKEHSSWNDNSATKRVQDSSEDAAVAADGMDDFSDLEDTPVYYFPDGTPVPEHLLCPEKWVGVYIDDVEYSEVEQHLQAVAREIVANHNPNRPLAEVWSSFIEDETLLWAVSKDAGKIQAIGSNRIDGMYEQMRKYPEIFEIVLEEGPAGRWVNVYHVEMDILEPDWNVITLPDGRDFRVKDGYRYQIYTNDSSALPLSICLSDFSTAQLIVIDNLDQTSDAELERLGGWDYNFNPYTNQ